MDDVVVEVSVANLPLTILIKSDDFVEAVETIMGQLLANLLDL